MELEETKQVVFNHMLKNRELIKGTFDQKSRPRTLTKRDLILMWNKRKENPCMHMMFDCLWLGPFKIEKMAGTNLF